MRVMLNMRAAFIRPWGPSVTNRCLRLVFFGAVGSWSAVGRPAWALPFVQAHSTCDTAWQVPDTPGPTPFVAAALRDSTVAIISNGLTDFISIPDTSDKPLIRRLRKTVGPALPAALLAIINDSSPSNPGDGERVRQAAAWIYGEMRFHPGPLEQQLMSHVNYDGHPELASRAFRALTAWDFRANSLNPARRAFLCRLASKIIQGNDTSRLHNRMAADIIDIASAHPSDAATRLFRDPSIGEAARRLVERGYLDSWRW